jgi:hypothetical protein
VLLESDGFMVVGVIVVDALGVWKCFAGRQRPNLRRVS